MKRHEIDPAIVAKIRAKALKELDAKLRERIERGGPILLWIGEGEFPGRAFRGLLLSRNRLSKWLEVN